MKKVLFFVCVLMASSASVYAAVAVEAQLQTELYCIAVRGGGFSSEVADYLRRNPAILNGIVRSYGYCAIHDQYYETRLSSIYLVRALSAIPQ